MQTQLQAMLCLRGDTLTFVGSDKSHALPKSVLAIGRGLSLLESAMRDILKGGSGSNPPVTATPGRSSGRRGCISWASLESCWNVSAFVGSPELG